MQKRNVSVWFAIGCALMVCQLLGCQRGNSGAEPNTGANPAAADLPQKAVDLNILVVGSDGLGPLIKRQWEAESESGLTVTEISLAELAAQEFRLAPQVDVVVYPGAIQADLMAREQLLEIPANLWNSDEIGKAELLGFYRSNLIRFGNQFFAVPLGGQQLCLIYRTDVLADLELPVPRTWQDLTTLAQRLRERETNAAGTGQPLPQSIALPLADDWSGHLLLAISAASVRSSGKLSSVLQAETLTPLIDRPPYRDAYAVLRELTGDQAETMAAWHPEDAYRAVATGRAAVAITWPSRHFAVEAPTATENLGIAELPGSSRFFDFANNNWVNRDEDQIVVVPYLGLEQRVASTARNSLHAPQSLEFIVWLTNKRTSGQLAEESPWLGPFRSSQLADAQQWTGSGIKFEVAEQFAEVIRAAHDTKLALVFPRVAGQTEMLATLAKSVRENLVVRNEQSDWLSAVAKQWEQQLQALGLNRQRELFRRGEGL